MGILDTYSTNAFYGFFNQKIANAFSGTVWRISKNGSTGTVGTTTDIGFTASGVLDNSAIDTFKGAGEIRLNRWYRQDPHGAEPSYLEQNDWDDMPEVVWDSDNEEYVVRFGPNRITSMEIADSRNLVSHTAFFIMEKLGDLPFSGTTHNIYSSLNTFPQVDLRLSNLNETLGDPFAFNMEGTGTDGPKIALPTQSGRHLYTAHIKRGSDVGTDTVSKFMEDGTQFGSNFYFSSSINSGLRIGGARGNHNLKGLILYSDYLADATVDSINNDIFLSFVDTAISGNVKEKGTNVSGARVPIFSATNLELDGLNLEETVVTDASGNFSSTIVLGAKVYIAFPFWNDNNVGKSQKPIILDRR